jgi:site-specific recombinase XerD
VKERGRKRMPEHVAYAAVLKFARERGELVPHSKGSLPPYLWSIMEIAYLCRMRGIEAVRLTDAHASDEGLLVRRVKGSRDSVVRWTPRLRAAWDAAVALRAVIRSRKSNRHRPVPIRPQDRYVFLSESGTPLSKAGLDNAFQDLMQAAIAANVITEAERFNLHGLKHRGITDTPGVKGDKKAASGHKTDAALNEYDHEVPTVDPAKAPEF